VDVQSTNAIKTVMLAIGGPDSGPRPSVLQDIYLDRSLVLRSVLRCSLVFSTKLKTVRLGNAENDGFKFTEFIRVRLVALI
jgi:hypothetical protein